MTSVCFSKHQWNLLKIALLLLLLLSNAPESGRAESRKKQIEMLISAVSVQAEREAGRTNGGIWLRYVNDSDEVVRIPFCRAHGLIFQDKEWSPRFKLKNNEDVEHECSFSTLKYEWRNSNGSCLSGIYEISSDDLTVPPKESRRLLIPIRTPSAYGAYRLHVSFDNLCLSRAEQSFNDQTSFGPGRRSFFIAVNDAQIDVIR